MSVLNSLLYLEAELSLIKHMNDTSNRLVIVRNKIRYKYGLKDWKKMFCTKFEKTMNPLQNPTGVTRSRRQEPNKWDMKEILDHWKNDNKPIKVCKHASNS